MNEPVDPARGRFLVIMALRWSGVVLAVIGVAILAGKVDLPEFAGYALVLVGAMEALVLPTVLARAWRTPPR